MANWAFTDYVIEGPTIESVKKIEQAILHHPVEEGSAENWEGNVLKALNIEWEPVKPDGSGKYMGGFINGEPWWDNGVLRFSAEEAWGVTGFAEVLEENFPEIKVYWTTEEPDCEVYQTNDEKGKYFNSRIYVDTCIDGNYDSDYFTKEEDMNTWLSKLTNGKITCEKEAIGFNESPETDPDDFINIHHFRIVK